MTILFLSLLFVFSLSLNRNLHSKFRNYKSSDLTNDNNDELGGSLLDALNPSPTSTSKLFDQPDKEPTSNIAPAVDLNKIVNQMNQPALKIETPPVENPNSSPKETPTPAPKENPILTPEEPTPSQKENQTIPFEKNTTEITKVQTKALNSTSTPEKDKLTIKSVTKNNTSVPPTPLPLKAATKNSSKREVASPVSVPKPTPPPKIVQVPVIVYSNQTCNLTMVKNIHKPFPIPETYDMRYMSILVIIIFGTSFLALRLILSLFKTYRGEDSFLLKGLKTLANQTFIYFLCLGSFIIIYTFGLFDKLPINWEYLIASLSIFGISWVVFCLIILFFSLLVKRKWKELETNARDDFRSIKVRYDNLANKKYDSETNKKSIDTSFFFELYEYLTLKIYFCIPFFPVFKASTLRREFKFYIYLSYCLLQKLRLFFKLSWTCWIITIFFIFVWSVFITPESILFITIFMMCIPILGLLLSLILFNYMKHIYRKVISEINGDNYMSYLDIKHFNQNFACGEFTSFPVYLDNVIAKPEEGKLSKINFHEHFHHRTPSIYEDEIIFGATGFFLLINILQAVGFLFVIWSVLLFAKYFSEIINAYGYASIAFILPLLLIYIIGYAYLISISLKWYTIISSIEMKRNDECIKKTINDLLKRTAEISNSIFFSFKRIYFDMRVNNKNKAGNETAGRDNFNSLGKQTFKSLVDLSVARFKKIPDDKQSQKTKSIDDYPINVNNELRGFLKSCGNKLSEKEIEFMLHLVENFENLHNGEITRRHLYDIWGAIMHFSTLPPEEIINYVFDQYFFVRNDIDTIDKRDSKEMDLEKIEAILEYYNEYFTQEQVQFIREESSYLGESFSRDAFNYMLLAPRRYYPN